MLPSSLDSTDIHVFMHASLCTHVSMCTWICRQIWMFSCMHICASVRHTYSSSFFLCHTHTLTHTHTHNFRLNSLSNTYIIQCLHAYMQTDMAYLQTMYSKRLHALSCSK
ncbi:Hypothetical predicted protein [Octopus vulgaris]|uniref:Uncharacterized protein n=1 Tax=Octopus vulgaris TaxID=6645 RepID=A0AA36AP81_OCTVU|nr:Hypothetical predicted protein [Octopus vulgaris]